MKTSFPLLLLLFIALFGFTACQDDDDDTSPNVDELNYDTGRFSAPLTGQGTTTFAAFFPAEEVRPFAGRTLESVVFWLETIPDATSVVVYEVSGNDRSPGNELYRVNLTQRINSTGWYSHNLPGGTNLDVPAEGLWLAVEATQAVNGIQSVGCDDGGNYSPNGDRMLPPTGGVWTSFNEITGSESINWNIRGLIARE